MDERYMPGYMRATSSSRRRARDSLHGPRPDPPSRRSIPAFDSPDLSDRATMDTSRFEEALHRLGYEPGIDHNSIDDWFPNRAEADAFCQFAKDRIAADSARRAGPNMTCEQLVTAIDSSNLLTLSFAYTVLPALNTPIRPWVPVGRCANELLYRLVPDGWGLSPDEEEVWDETSKLSPYILAAKSSEGQDEFAFIQLGALECTKDGQGHWPMTKDSVEDDAAAERLEWKETGFYLVARIGQQGRIDGVYAIYNMEWEDPLTGQDGRYRPEDKNWGKPPGYDDGDEDEDEDEDEDREEKQIFCAWLADRMGGFGGGYHICWDQVTFSSPVRLGYVSRDRLVHDVPVQVL